MEGSTEELRRGEGRRKQLTSRVGLILRRSRAARGWPWSAQARPQVLIGRSRSRIGRDVRIEESGRCAGPNRWLVETIFHRDVIQREISRVLVPTSLAKNAALGT